ARSSRADDRKHPRISLVDQRDRVEQLLLAAEERCRRGRELDAPRRAQRGELALAELVDANRAVEVLEPVPAEVAERLRVEERCRVTGRPERVQQACRPFDVGEEQRDRALRKLTHGTDDDYPGAAPNQRARRVGANAAFSAASSSDGPTTVAAGDGPPRKFAS